MGAESGGQEREQEVEEGVRRGVESTGIEGEKIFSAAVWSVSSTGAATLDSQLSGGVDGAMFVLSYTLVHPRIHQSEAADLQAGAAHFNPVLKRFLHAGRKRGKET